MTIETEPTIPERLAQIEKDHNVSFTFDYEANAIEAEGNEPDIKAALTQLQPRASFAEAIKARQPPPKVKRVKVTLNAEVPAKEIQRSNYIRWFTAKPKYFQPSEEQLDRMFSAVEEGDECLFDFAHSFTVRKPDGRLVSINRQGKVEKPSIYSPHLPKPIGDEE